MMLSVIIVSFNTRDATLACITSVFAQTRMAPEIVVVDNGSTDGSADAIRARFPHVIVDEARENLGFARGVNRGVAASSGDHVVLLNPDTLVLAGALDTLVEFAQRHPQYGVYGGRTLRRDGSVEKSSCWGAPSLWSLFCFASGLSTAFRGSRVFDPESLGPWERDTVREVPIVTGCLLLMRRADWDTLGGMDEAFFLYGEDAEFSIRASRNGLRPVIVPDASIIHDVGGSTSVSAFKMSLVLAGKTTLLRDVWSPGRARTGRRLLLAGVGLRALLERVAGRRRGTWSTAWSRRADWLPGYPSARESLFGLPPIS